LSVGGTVRQRRKRVESGRDCGRGSPDVGTVGREKES
jgi:hypothetical protein